MELGIVPEFELVEQLRVGANRLVGVGGAQVGGRAKVGGEGQEDAAGGGDRIGRTLMPRYAVRDSLGRVRLEVGARVEFNAAARGLG